jgi:tetratricopeptide (TPR) repeat protein
LAGCSSEQPQLICAAKAEEQIKGNNLAEAEKLLKKAQADQEQSKGANDVGLAPTLTSLGDLYSRQGKYAEASTLFDRAADIQQKAMAPQLVALTASLNGKGLALMGQGKFVAAEQVLQQALAIREDNLPAGALPGCREREQLGAAVFSDLLTILRPKRLYKGSISTYEKVKGAESPEAANVRNNLASLYYAQGKYQQAEPIFKWSVSVFERTCGQRKHRCG